MAVLNRIRLGSRLALGFGALIVAALTAFCAATWLGRSGQAAISEVGQRAAERVALLARMRDDQLIAVSTIRNAGLQTDGAAINAEVDAFHAALKDLAAAEAEFAKLDNAAEESQILERAVALRREAEPIAEQAVRYSMAFAGEEAAKLLTSRLAPLQVKWAGELQHLTELNRERDQADMQAIVAANDRKALVLGLTLLGAILAAAWFAVAVTRSVTGPLLLAANLASRVADGDLQVQVPVEGKDEAAQLLQSLSRMTEQLASIVLALRASAERVAESSAEITRGNLDLSARTERQAAALEQTSASIQGLTEMVNMTSSNAAQARELARRTSAVAGSGNQAMGEVEQTMQRISESSNRISDIIGVIDGIAFQTNILALNAAVEAARAGDQGRGFAVVATEVRALAQRVTTAAREVRDLIGESVGRVGEGSRLVGMMGQNMQELLDGVEQVNRLVGEISSASSRQSTSIAEVNGAVREIDQSTQQNASMVEEVAAAAQSLTGQTQSMAELVRRFRVAHA